jgi:hypothetical protein
MKKTIKTILIIIVILGLILMAFQKDIERKRMIVINERVYKEYSQYRDSTKLIIKAYKDTLRVLRTN